MKINIWTEYEGDTFNGWAEFLTDNDEHIDVCYSLGWSMESAAIASVLQEADRRHAELHAMEMLQADADSGELLECEQEGGE